MTPPPPPLHLPGLTLVVGLGLTGLSCLARLRRLGAEAAVVDSRADPPGLDRLRRDFPEVPCHLGGFPEALFLQARRLLVSPGLSLDLPVLRQARQRGVEVLGDIELFARLARAPVAAITGSNGKSTVTTLLGLMGQASGRRTAMGGNLGPPALDLLDDNVELYVLELSSFQLETTTSLRPAVAALLNISPDHMDRYAGLDDYIAAKRRIFRGAARRVLNADDPVAAGMDDDAPARRFTLAAPRVGDFGLRRHRGETWLCRGGEPWLAASQLLIPGRHNLANALAALALGEALGLAREAMLEVLRTFPGLPHRCRLVARHNDIAWYDDSKGTNVGATLASVQGLPGPLVLIAGGDGKDQDFTPLGQGLAGKLRAAVLIGRDAPRIAAVLDGVVELHRADDMAGAVRQAARLARPGDSVLLSPACASFDMFRDYRQRGEVFAAQVKAVLP